MNEETLNLIIETIRSGRCLAFLGAGACTPFVNKDGEVVPGLPTGAGLARHLADRCGYTNGQEEKTDEDTEAQKNYDLLKVAEYFVYKYSDDRRQLEKAIQEVIDVSCEPRPIHTVLAQLNQIKFVITSNYDSLIEWEMRKYKRQLMVNVYDATNPKNGHWEGPLFNIPERKAILHKMHGTIEKPETLIVTQSDYIRYLAMLNDTDRGMPEYFRKNVIPQFTLLFLGYSLEDWNFRVIWEGLFSSRPLQRILKSYALVNDADNFKTAFWAQRKVTILNHDITAFAKKLAEEFNLEIPQLGIERTQDDASNQASENDASDDASEDDAS